jgi:hypothetical protein
MRRPSGDDEGCTSSAGCREIFLKLPVRGDNGVAGELAYLSTLSSAGFTGYNGSTDNFTLSGSVAAPEPSTAGPVVAALAALAWRGKEKLSLEEPKTCVFMQIAKRAGSQLEIPA